MRKLLLLSALSMIATLLFASAATAQGACPQGTTNVEGECLLEDGSGQTLDQLLACEGIPSQEEFEACAAEQAAAGNPNFADFAPEDTSAAPETAISCDQFIALGTGEPSQLQAQQFFDFVATPEERAILDPDGNGFACDESVATATVTEPPATTSEAHTALPDTGGLSLLLPVSALLIGAGLLGFVVKRRVS